MPVDYATVQTNLKGLTGLNEDIAQTAASVSVVNFFISGPKLINSLRDYVQSVNLAVQTLGPQTGTLSDAEAKSLVEDLKAFVASTKKRSDSIIAKHGLFSKTPFTAPIAAVLRIAEGGGDALFFKLNEIAPSQKDAIQEQYTAWSTSVAAAINTYA